MRTIIWLLQDKLQAVVIAASNIKGTIIDRGQSLADKIKDYMIFRVWL